jgi:uncharacterized repeat protein (TIGR03803 family)
MRIVSRGTSITIAVLSLAGSALAAPVETVLYTFAGASDGHVPFAGLIFDNDGALYGTTVSGGIGNNGTVFKLTPPAKGQTGWKETVLYSFCSLSNCSDGAQPRASLIADEQGALYSTTEGGGVGNNGTVFKLTPSPNGATPWKETVLYRFCSLSSCSDGSGPYASLFADKEGALYSTTSSGGTSSTEPCCYGTVFELAP